MLHVAIYAGIDSSRSDYMICFYYSIDPFCRARETVLYKFDSLYIYLKRNIETKFNLISRRIANHRCNSIQLLSHFPSYRTLIREKSLSR